MPRTGGAATRERIIDAAAGVLTDLGLARATTKEIARVAGISEAALYKHFAGKEELFVTVLNERLPGFGATVMDDPQRPTDRDVAANLTDVVRTAVRFYRGAFPMSASLFLERGLLRRHRAVMHEMGTGPRRPIQRLEAYLRAEQARGRVAADARPDLVAGLLLGACFQRGFLAAYEEAELDPTDLEDAATGLVSAVLPALLPEPPAPNPTGH